MTDIQVVLKYPVALPPTPTKFGLTSPRGAKLATRFWPVQESSSAAKALCLIVHGGGTHSGYFEGLANVLTAAGIICGSYDQVSCGYSDPEPGTPRPGVTHIQNFDCFIEDLFEAVKWLKKESGEEENLPLFLIGESFGGLQVMDAAFQAAIYQVKIDGVVCLGGLLEVSAKFLPPAPVVKILVFLSNYYPRLVMPATDFESTFDDAFGDKDWAQTFRRDPKISVSIQPTIGSIASILATGAKLRPKAKEFPSIPFLAIHGQRDVRTSVEAMVQFVDQMGPNKASMILIDTDGHQLLQDVPEISRQVMHHVQNWIEAQINAAK